MTGALLDFPSMLARLLLTGSLLALTACGEWKVDSEALTARTGTPAQGMTCSGCHAYPLADRNHDYHLNNAPRNDRLNGRITCLDCHSKSLHSVSAVILDSVFEDTATTEKWHTVSNPGANDTTSDGRRIRGLFLNRVDSLLQNHPVDMPRRPGPAPAFQEYVTGLAHLNGKVDVAFDARNSAPEKFDGDTAYYNPTQETCSALACHPGPKIYRWAAPSKGLPELKDVEGSP